MKKATKERFDAMERRIAELEAQVLALKADPYRLYQTVPIPPSPSIPSPSWPYIVTCGTYELAVDPSQYVVGGVQ